MTSFKDLKKTKQDLSKLLKALENKEGQKKDDRFFVPEVDKAGIGYVELRFLPASQGEDIPWVKVLSHSFQGPNGWYIENNLSTLGKKDPVSTFNYKMWNSGIEANKNIVRRQKLNTHYISNVLVLKYPTNPELEGKVFLFRYGKKIFEKVQNAMQPKFADEKAFIPFDFWEGANFILKIQTVAGYRNYDKAYFTQQSALFDGNDEKLDAVWKKEFSLQEFINEKNFKSYDDLKARFDSVWGFDTANVDVFNIAKETPATKETVKPKEVVKEKTMKEVLAQPEMSLAESFDKAVGGEEVDDDDEELEKIRKLVD